MSDIGTVVGLIKALAPKPTAEDITTAVDAWLDDHPEATTTVEDGAISYAKLDSSLKGTVDDVSSLKTSKIPNITYGEPEVVLAETTLNFTKDGDNDWYYAEIDNFNLVANTDQRSMFIVEFDGVEYGGLYYSMSGVSLNGSTYSSYFIGDGLCIGMKRMNNCPFCVQCYYGGTKFITRIIAYNSQASHTVKISAQNVEDIVVTSKETYYEADLIQSITFGSGNNAHGIGSFIADLSGNYAFAIGLGTIASGYASYVEGTRSTASGITSHAEGSGTTASGEVSHAEGNNTTASGIHSHAEGGTTTASGLQSHAEGFRTIANHRAQHVFGRRNVPDPSTADSTDFGTYVEIVGNGTANNALSNARTLDWSGNEALAGGITLGMGTADEVTLSAAQLKQLLALLN